MVWFVILHLFSTVLDWFRIGRMSEQKKDLEILLLRQQLAAVNRIRDRPFRPSRIERFALAVFTAKLRETSGCTVNQLRGVLRIFQPETVLRWHREQMVLCLARENPSWGYGKIQGELSKFGFGISRQSPISFVATV